MIQLKPSFLETIQTEKLIDLFASKIQSELLTSLLQQATNAAFCKTATE